MNKIFKPFIKFFRAFYHIIDKIIVTPISRLVYKIGEISRENSNRLEKILNRPNILIYLSLLCALGLFLLVDSKVINLNDHNAQIIEDQKIKVNYSSGLYVVEGVPETVDITLIGSKSNLYLATQLGNHEVELDLTKYGVGTYKVPLKYNHSIHSIDYKLDPSAVTVKISEKLSETKNLSYDLLNIDKLDPTLSIPDSGVKLTGDGTVVVQSSKEILDKVAVVKALIDTSLIDSKTTGEITIENVEVAAYDTAGNKLNNVELVPAKVNATITIDSYYVEKPIKVVSTGKMDDGKAISSAVSSVKKVLVYGEKSVVDKLEYIEAPINLSKINASKTVSVPLTQPQGVRYMSTTNTNVQVTVGSASQRLIEGVYVKFLNVPSDLVAQTLPGENTIDVYITGAESVINQLDASSIVLSVNCSGYERGTHLLDVDVTVLTPFVTAEPTKKKINVKIY